MCRLVLLSNVPLRGVLEPPQEQEFLYLEHVLHVTRLCLRVRHLHFRWVGPLTRCGRVCVAKGRQFFAQMV